MIKRKNLTIILLIGVLVMNTGILCESLCLAGHGTMADSPIPHDMISHSKHKPSETQACPISESHNHSDNAESKTFIKCDCSSENDSFIDHDLKPSASADLIPYLQVASNIQPYSIVFTDNILIPSERPPEIFA